MRHPPTPLPSKAFTPIFFTPRTSFSQRTHDGSMVSLTAQDKGGTPPPLRIRCPPDPHRRVMSTRTPSPYQSIYVGIPTRFLSLVSDGAFIVATPVSRAKGVGTPTHVPKSAPTPAQIM